MTIAVHDRTESAASGATVAGIWNGDAADSASCVTDVSGACSVTRPKIKTKVNSVTFVVSEVSYGAMLYQPAVNHDPDGDSDGSQITVWMP